MLPQRDLRAGTRVPQARRPVRARTGQQRAVGRYVDIEHAISVAAHHKRRRARSDGHGDTRSARDRRARWPTTMSAQAAAADPVGQDAPKQK